MNFYDPSQYASDTNTLTPLASDAKVFRLRTVLINNDATIKIINEDVPCERIEEVISYGDCVDFDGNDVYYYPASELSMRLDDVYGGLVTRVITQILSIDYPAVRIGEFNTCQIYLKTLDVKIDEVEDAICEKVLVDERTTLLYTD